MDVKIVKETISINELKEMAAARFGNLVKAVVDVNRGMIAVDAELHSDLEALFLEDGSRQNDLWGINLYPDLSGDDFVEFDSLINLKPSMGNRSRGVEDEKMRSRIGLIMAKMVQR